MLKNILNQISQVIENGIKVEAKPPVVKNGMTRIPILVTDVSKSFTNGWFIRYNPVPKDNYTHLYDGSETFTDLHIARFSQLHEFILTANYYFLKGEGVTEMSDKRLRAIYEPNESIRLTVTSRQNSVSVVVTIVDVHSPFHMMSIPFSVGVSNKTGEYYVIGTDSQRWDRNTDTFRELNASFARRKQRFFRVEQEANKPATLRKAKIALTPNGHFDIHKDGSFTLDMNRSTPEYLQVIHNEYKALAYIYEQTIIKKAFAMAIEQGLPGRYVSEEKPVPSVNHQFVPAFALHQTEEEKAEEQTKAQAVPVGSNGPIDLKEDDLPWGE